MKTIKTEKIYLPVSGGKGKFKVTEKFNIKGYAEGVRFIIDENYHHYEDCDITVPFLDNCIDIEEEIAYQSGELEEESE